MKNKYSGVHIASLYDHGYVQVDGVNYDSYNIVSPVTNDTNIKNLLVF